MKNINETLGRPVNNRNLKIAGAEALAYVGITTIHNHRLKTHHSLKPKPAVENINRTAMWLLATVPRYWARVHTSHHAARDANLLNILETADCLQWLEDKKELKVTIPEKFHGLDRVAQLTPADVRAIGESAREQVRDRYDRPENYSAADLRRLLDPITKRFFYPEKSKVSKATQIRAGDRSIHRLYSTLVDPHSPALHRHGILGILFDNLPLYKANQADVKAFEEIGEYDLGRDEKDKKFFDKGKWGLVAFFGGNILVQAAIKKEFSVRALGEAVIAGTLVGLGAAQGLKIGGDVTNSAGHAGTSIIRGILEGAPLVNPTNGTFAYNAKLLNPITLDEVGGQKNHHEKPWRRAYTDATGVRKFRDAPFGTAIDALTRRHILFEPGDDFGHPEIVEANEMLSLDSMRNFVRPDEPMEAVLMLEAARVRTLNDMAA